MGGNAHAVAKRGEKTVAPRTVAKIEPKTFFANERTFIQWLSAATLLVTLSILLLGSDLNYARTCGFVVMPVAAGVCAVPYPCHSCQHVCVSL